jgi:hypothetical protein
MLRAHLAQFKKEMADKERSFKAELAEREVRRIAARRSWVAPWHRCCQPPRPSPCRAQLCNTGGRPPPAHQPPPPTHTQPSRRHP